jgi:hypothetical protein
MEEESKVSEHAAGTDPPTNVTTSGKTCFQRFYYRGSFCLGVDHPSYIVSTPNQH